MASKENPILNQEEMPPPTPWRYLFGTHFIWKFEDENPIRVNFTKERFVPYQIWNLLLIIAWFVCYCFLLKYFSPDNKSKQTLHFALFTFFAFMGLLCYGFTHYTNPGIVPYNWSESKQRIFTNDELRSGMTTTREQVEWGKSHDWPPRSFFSGRYGGLVLRADHFCDGVHHWVGLKNLRYFVQAHIYCALFSTELGYIMIKIALNPDARTWKNALYWLPVAGYSLLVFGSQMLNLVYILPRIARNQTMLEAMQKLDPSFYDRGFIRNCEEVFGSVYLFPLWFFPIPLPLPNDGFSYSLRPKDPCIFANRLDEFLSITPGKRVPLLIIP